MKNKRLKLLHLSGYTAWQHGKQQFILRFIPGTHSRVITPVQCKYYFHILGFLASKTLTRFLR